MPEFPRPASNRRGLLAGLLAVASIMLVQTAGISLSSHNQATSHASGSPAPPVPPAQLKVEKGPADRQVAITFPAGTSAEVAQQAVRRFDLTLIGGDAATGRYLFSLPQVEITAAGPGQAIVYFPASATGAAMRGFVAEHHLSVFRWFHNVGEGLVWALVALPAPPASPSLRATLPAGLTWQLVANWARQHGVRLLSYNPITGSTVLAPAIPYRAPAYPPAFLSPPIVTHAHPLPAPRPATPLPVKPPAQPVAVPTSSLYIGFAAAATDQDIRQISQKHSLQLTALGSTGLKLATVDASRAPVLRQLLSDLPQVACVADSQAACAATLSVAAPPATPPAAPPTTTDVTPPTSPATLPPTTTDATPPASTPAPPPPPAVSAAPVLVGDALQPAGRHAGSGQLNRGGQPSAGPVKVTVVGSGPLGAAAPISVPAHGRPVDPPNL